ncbi:hypothetical protein IWW54_000022 [Coemansia sp. RSA 2705]|nr:hypothetical protein IWW54_000022 [Coemansia sp. RSA 2705]
MGTRIRDISAAPGRQVSPRYVQQHQTRLRMRQSLVARLSAEFPHEADILADLNDDETTPMRRHILVRELIAAVRAFDNVEYVKADVDESTGETALSSTDQDQPAVARAAWEKYQKITTHPEAAKLMQQIPDSAIGLLICELNYMGAAHDYGSRFQCIVRIWGDCQEHGRPIQSQIMFGMYLRALNKLGGSRQVLAEVGAQLPGDQLPRLHPAAMRQLISACFSCRQAEKAMELFRHVMSDPYYSRTHSLHIYTTVVQGAVRTNHLSNADLYIIVEELFEDLTHTKYNDNIRLGLVNELLHTARIHGNMGLLLYVFERYLAHKYPINNATLGILLKVVCSGNIDAGEVHSIYRNIVADQATRLQMTGHVFATFIGVFVRLQRPDCALVVVQDMRAHPNAQRAARYLEPLFGCFAESGMGQPALELFHSLVEQDKLEPTWRIYFDVVKALSRGSQRIESGSGLHSEADALLATLVESGAAADTSRMLGAFSELCSRNLQSPLSLAALFIKAHQIIGTYVLRLSNQYDFTQITVGIRSHDELAQFVARLDHAVAELFALKYSQVPQDLFVHAICVFVLAQDQAQAQRIYDHMTQHRQLTPTWQTFNVLSRAFARGLGAPAAMDVFREMQTNGMRLRNVTAAMLIHGLLDADRPHEALEVYAYLVGRPTPVVSAPGFREFTVTTSCDVYTYALLIEGLVQAAMHREAVVVFEDAFSVLSWVPRQLLETFVRALENAGRADFALACLMRYRKRVEESQPVSSRDPVGESVSEPAPDLLSPSHFGYLLGKVSKRPAS